MMMTAVRKVRIFGKQIYENIWEEDYLRRMQQILLHLNRYIYSFYRNFHSGITPSLGLIEIGYCRTQINNITVKSVGSLCGLFLRK